MKAVSHPIFDTVYIDPVEGVLWEGELPYAGGSVKGLLFIPRHELATTEAIEFAASCAADLAGLDAIAREALSTSLSQQPQGPCHRYWLRFIAPLLHPMPDPAVARPAPLQHQPSAVQFQQHIHLSLIGMYPTQAETPLMLEYTAKQAQFPTSLRVRFNAQAHPVDIFLERDTPSFTAPTGHSA